MLVSDAEKKRRSLSLESDRMVSLFKDNCDEDDDPPSLAPTIVPSSAVEKETSSGAVWEKAAPANTSIPSSAVKNRITSPVAQRVVFGIPNKLEIPLNFILDNLEAKSIFPANFHCWLGLFAVPK